MRTAPYENPRTGLYTANLRLRFQLRRHHFVQGHVSVKCTAQVYSEYRESSELYLQGLGLGEKALESRTNGEDGGTKGCHVTRVLLKCRVHESISG